jgi:hypothetical protein
MLNLQPFKKKLKKSRINLKNKKKCQRKYNKWCLKCKVVSSLILPRILVLNQNLMNNLTAQRFSPLLLKVGARVRKNLIVIKNL